MNGDRHDEFPLDEIFVSGDTPGIPTPRYLCSGEFVDVPEMGVHGLTLTGSAVRVAVGSGGEMAAMLRREELEFLGSIAFLELAMVDRCLAGPELRLLRRRAGITQEDLGKALGVDRGTVIQWEQRPALDVRTSLAVQRLMQRRAAGLVARWPAELLARNSAVLSPVLDLTAANSAARREYVLRDGFRVLFDPRAGEVASAPRAAGG